MLFYNFLRRKTSQPTANPISPCWIGYILLQGDMELVGKGCGDYYGKSFTINPSKTYLYERLCQVLAV